LTRPAPWGYAIEAGDTAVVRLVRRHGVVVERLTQAWSGDGGPQFRVDSTVVAAQAFEGHRLVRLVGRWVPGDPRTLAPGTHIVRLAQPLGILAMYLLEPESDDGVVAWDVGGRAAAGGQAVVRVYRLEQPIPGRLERVPEQ
jgi:hypothetical protein